MEIPDSTRGWMGSGVDSARVQFGGTRGDELTARADLASHEQIEDPGRVFGVLDADATQNPVLGVHGGLGQLVGVHLTEALVPLDRFLPGLSLALELDELLAQLPVAVAVDLLRLTLLRPGHLDPVPRRPGGAGPPCLPPRVRVRVDQRPTQAT